MQQQNVFTTGEAAKICQVSLRTVIRWVESGVLKGHQFAGPGGHRRIFKKHLLTFLEDNDLPVPAELQDRAHRILIVEDEVTIALQMQDTLVAADFKASIAADGFTAGRLLESFEPDVITLDLRIPGLPGIEVLKKVRSKDRAKHLSVLVVSGMPPDELAEALREGADEVLTKPFADEELVERITRLVNLASVSPEGGA